MLDALFDPRAPHQIMSICVQVSDSDQPNRNGWMAAKRKQRSDHDWLPLVDVLFKIRPNVEDSWKCVRSGSYIIQIVSTKDGKKRKMKNSYFVDYRFLFVDVTEKKEHSVWAQVSADQTPSKTRRFPAELLFPGRN